MSGADDAPEAERPAPSVEEGDEQAEVAQATDQAEPADPTPSAENLRNPVRKPRLTSKPRLTRRPRRPSTSSYPVTCTDRSRRSC